MVKAAPDEALDQGLWTDIELPGSLAQFLQHILVQINPDAVERRHHLALVRKVGRYVLSLVCEASYRFCGYWSLSLRGSFHIAFVLRW